MSLEEIIQILQKKSSSETLIYKEYNNLFLHCLKYNLNKVLSSYINTTDYSIHP